MPLFPREGRPSAPPSLAERGEPPPGPGRPAGEALWARSVRFAVTVTPPVILGATLHGPSWIVYALLTVIAAYSADVGGRPAPRFAWMAAPALAIVAGAALGSLAAGATVATVAALALGGVVYALTESGHQLVLTTSRFACFGLAVGALAAPLGPADLGAVAAFLVFAWAVSVGWDAILGRRPSIAPTLGQIVAALDARRLDRWIFALSVAVTVPLAFVTATLAGLEKPYWAMLAFVLVLRVDFMSSRKLMIDRFLGTVLGVMAAGAYAWLLPTHTGLLVGIVLAALARWPAQQRHGALGVGALTAFVMLMIELFAASTGQALVFLEARVADTGLGCAFALVALGLDRTLRRLAPGGG